MRNALRAVRLDDAEAEEKRPEWRLVGNVAQTGLLKSTRERDAAARAVAQRRRMRAMRGAVAARSALDTGRHSRQDGDRSSARARRARGGGGAGDYDAERIVWVPPPATAERRNRRALIAAPTMPHSFAHKEDVDRIDAMDEFVASFARRSYQPLSFADEVEAGHRDQSRRDRAGLGLDLDLGLGLRGGGGGGGDDDADGEFAFANQLVAKTTRRARMSSSEIDIDAVLSRNAARLAALGGASSAGTTVYDDYRRGSSVATKVATAAGPRHTTLSIADRTAAPIAALSPMVAHRRAMMTSPQSEVELSMGGSSRWVPQLFEV